MVEIKAENELESTEVKEKAQAGMLFCRRATEFTVANNGKIWKYSLIPHSAVAANMGALTLINKYIQ
jgi:type III restriction enzyme